jgi:hypothetical protein
MKKFILEYKRYSQKCPEPLRRRMQHFILDDHLDIIVDFEIMTKNRDDFIVSSLLFTQMSLNDENTKMEKQDLSLSTYTQYMDDFKFWMMTAGNAHKPPEKVIVKLFASGLKPFRANQEVGP